MGDNYDRFISKDRYFLRSDQNFLPKHSNLLVLCQSSFAINVSNRSSRILWKCCKIWANGTRLSLSPLCQTGYIQDHDYDFCVFRLVLIFTDLNIRIWHVWLLLCLYPPINLQHSQNTVKQIRPQFAFTNNCVHNHCYLFKLQISKSYTI